MYYSIFPPSQYPAGHQKGQKNLWTSRNTENWTVVTLFN